MPAFPPMVEEGAAAPFLLLEFGLHKQYLMLGNNLQI